MTKGAPTVSKAPDIAFLTPDTLSAPCDAAYTALGYKISATLAEPSTTTLGYAWDEGAGGIAAATHPTVAVGPGVNVEAIINGLTFLMLAAQAIPTSYGELSGEPGSFVTVGVEFTAVSADGAAVAMTVAY